MVSTRKKTYLVELLLNNLLISLLNLWGKCKFEKSTKMICMRENKFRLRGIVRKGNENFEHTNKRV